MSKEKLTREDLMVFFAIRWGESLATEAVIQTATHIEQENLEKRKSYTQKQLTVMFNKWAEEYNGEDLNEYFEAKDMELFF